MRSMRVSIRHLSDCDLPIERVYALPMARMTPQEGNAVNVLASYLVGRGDQLPVEVVRALETLASRAHNRLQTGWDEHAVRRQWPYAFESTTRPPAAPGS